MVNTDAPSRDRDVVPAIVAAAKAHPAPPSAPPATSFPSGAGPYLSLWATDVPPLDADGSRTWLPDATVIACGRRVLALPIISTQPIPCPRCSAPPLPVNSPPSGLRVAHDIMGDHALSCARGGGLQHRHERLADATLSISARAGLPGWRRGGPVFTSHGHDVLLPDHAHSMGLAVDVTVVSGSPAAAETLKRTKYAAELKRHPALGFSPFAVLRWLRWPSVLTRLAQLAVFHSSLSHVRDGSSAFPQHLAEGLAAQLSGSTRSATTSSSKLCWPVNASPSSVPSWPFSSPASELASSSAASVFILPPHPTAVNPLPPEPPPWSAQLP